MTDLLLSIAHHLIVFGIVAALAAELALMRPAAMSAHTVRLLGRFDAAYGLLALAILFVGFARVFHGAKGPDFYLHNPVFWLKVGAFAVMGLLSIKPTLRIRAWLKSQKTDAAYVPPPDEVAAQRRQMMFSIHVFVIVPVAAAMMARGVGLG